MNLFDILYSEQLASEPDAMDVAQWMVGCKAIAVCGKIATFKGVYTHPTTGAIYLKSEMEVYPLRSGRGYPTAIFWLNLDGNLEG